MKKGTKCIVQTINLSNPKTCVRPKAVQKLVGTNGGNTFSDSDLASNHRPLTPATVRVCTRKDMQRTCKPKLYYRHEKPASSSLSIGERLCRAVMFLIKGTITTGLIYWTYSEGLWSDSGETKNLYYRIMSTIAPSLPAPPSGTDDIHLSHLERVKYPTFGAYNDAVIKSMDVTVSMPLAMYRKLRGITFSCDAIKETETDQSDETPTEM
ncbi:PREDICTED: uncharacterized protein LOC106752392 [Dinoponera quadriceps]|uniref:MICOS complex subunit MIC13 n=1 Tax=Dinoponera quadriceps TaxID=609295 RepID=A0A6P3YHY0_DINQU|nr:PREDICTED: uncharacterized protein LOC106752392 [Dinoponera quadriceps]